MSVMHARVARATNGTLTLFAVLGNYQDIRCTLDPSVDPKVRGTLQPALTAASAILERRGVTQLTLWTQADSTRQAFDFRAAVTA